MTASNTIQDGTVDKWEQAARMALRQLPAPQSAYTFLAVADAPRRMIGRLGLVAARLANHLIVDRGNVGIAGLLRRV